ncbi:Pre-rRNA-processing protein IPI3 [Metschnikowia bicuspidata var. bicuspidata NRRL YB-4993]|uniref:Pre-rRNA-processing protein IPI3 n=1 Tax=Metschnikowia bicuspidata var. bicuspidata NRRL YB-4993 TaxID=869754 RepID=A0A1A0HFA1_9ASCO|nr:Pre-rRNA-processing protein IPI3 [Metschnikowia bicuspidata var. bicuspidata NRRL YB-4993]OBA22563.1 Pre-rRNA-processing protein IPI3 [Metschnikowia bicuspidata var. bicuspidata NRRL YB-4993]
MDEVVLYVTAGDPADKHAQESVAAVASVHKLQQHATFRHAQCPVNGAAVSGLGAGSRLFVAGTDRALISTYVWGKEAPDQRLAVPELMACLALAPQPAPARSADAAKTTHSVPWLLAAGLASGKLYVWEVALGDLVCVKDAHYQRVASLAFSPCGSFLVSGGHDTRVNVWRTADLVAPHTALRCKPHALFSDHALAVTGVAFVAAPLGAGSLVASASRDGTLRIYDVAARCLQTTLVFLAAVECFARDPAGRAYYAGLADGSIRRVDMYAVNPHSHEVEAVGGAGRIVTVAADGDPGAAFGHLQTGGGPHATVLAVTMDGMSLVSGDTQGRVFVADVATRQVVKAYSACKLAIAHLHVGTCSTAALAPGGHAEKTHRLLPPLKRVLAAGVLADHTVTVQLPAPRGRAVGFAAWVDAKAQQEFEFRRDTGDDAAPKDGPADVAAVQAKLNTVSAAYLALRETYGQLLQAHEA